MDFGEFTLVLEDEGGRREVVLSATVRAPVANEWVDVDGRWYQVRLVTHQQLESNTARKHLGLTMFAVPIGPTGNNTPGPGGGEPPPNDSETPSSAAQGEASPSLSVLPFKPPSSSACAFFPAPLVLTLMACAYSEQSILFEAAKFEAWTVVHREQRWCLERAAAASADECRRLSREALYQFREAETYILERWPLVDAASDPSSNVFDLAAYRQIKKSSAQGGDW
jgi:hypothetical protein